ncbi:MAG: hypothetical protein Q8O92_15520 [Candidatus Latescibacter sp.]|nr:hypothetical protein [Candidatus Latescibacter sp.]
MDLQAIFEKMETKYEFKFSRRSWIAFCFGSLFGVMFFLVSNMAKDRCYDNISNACFWAFIATLFIVGLFVLYDVFLFLKYKYYDMALVAVISSDGFAFPQNRMNVKGTKYRKPTREDYIRWEIDDQKKQKYKEIPFISREDELQMNMNNPNLPLDKYKKLREEYDRQIKKKET